LGGLWALEWAWIGATVLDGLWALEWAWHPAGATVLGGLWALEWAWQSPQFWAVCGRKSGRGTLLNISVKICILASKL